MKITLLKEEDLVLKNYEIVLNIDPNKIIKNTLVTEPEEELETTT